MAGIAEAAFERMSLEVLMMDVMSWIMKREFRFP